MTSIDCLTFLQTTPLFADASYEFWQALSEKLHIINLNANDILIKQGDKNDNIYFVYQGQLSIAIQWRHQDMEVALANVGESVGELSFAGLQNNTITIKASEATCLLRLDRMALSLLKLQYPESLQTILQKISVNNQKVRFGSILRYNSLFSHLPYEALQALEQQLEYRFIPSGEMLSQEGDTMNAIFIVIIGRLRLWTKNPSRDNLFRKEIGQGQSIGEINIISNTPCTANIIAIRDTIVAVLPKEKATLLLREYPEAFAELWIKTTTQYYENKQLLSSGVNSSHTFVLVPLQANLPLIRIAECFAQALRKFGSTLLLDSVRLEQMLDQPQLAQLPLTDSRHGELLSWLNQQEFAYRFLIYVADETDSNWTRRCIHQADHVLFVASSAMANAQMDTEILVQRSASLPGIRKSLLLMHPEHLVIPQFTDKWLITGSVSMHHHLRLDNREDFAHLARLLTGRSIGLVLGGGGARGFAHIGVVKAMQQFGIPVDLIGGTSMGALIGAQLAKQIDPDDVLQETLRICKSGEQFTLPVVSLMRGAKFNRELGKLFQNNRIEDLWRRFFCVSCNLSEAELVIHDKGFLADAVLASNSAPGLLPPKYDARGLLVDGGLLNNVPFDVMLRYNEGGLTLVVDVDPKQDLLAKTPYQSGLSGWQILVNKLSPFHEKMQIPNIMDIIMRSVSIGGLANQQHQDIKRRADLYLDPPVADIPIMSYGKAQAVAKIGYDYACPRLERWLTNQLYSVK